MTASIRSLGTNALPSETDSRPLVRFVLVMFDDVCNKVSNVAMKDIDGRDGDLVVYGDF
jgi:hypothetical protein